MTGYALFNFWVWERTNQAFTMASLNVVAVFGGMLSALIGGPLVDRYDRKLVMLISDMIASVATVAYLVLFLNESLQLWHLYIGALFMFFFNGLHGLAFVSATTMIVPKINMPEPGGYAS